MGKYNGTLTDEEKEQIEDDVRELICKYSGYTAWHGLAVIAHIEDVLEDQTEHAYAALDWASRN